MSRKRQVTGMVILFCALLGLTAVLWGAEGQDEGKLLRNRIFKLKHISPEQVKDMLGELKVGSDVNILPRNSLIVTAHTSAELAIATRLVEIVDVEEEYILRMVIRKGDEKYMPTAEQMASALDTLAFGTFSDPPMSATKPNVILDIVNGQLAAVAPKSVMDSVALTAIKLYNENKKRQESPIEQFPPRPEHLKDETAESGPDVVEITESGPEAVPLTAAPQEPNAAMPAEEDALLKTLEEAELELEAEKEKAEETQPEAVESGAEESIENISQMLDKLDQEEAETPSEGQEVSADDLKKLLMAEETAQPAAPQEKTPEQLIQELLKSAGTPEQTATETAEAGTDEATAPAAETGTEAAGRIPEAEKELELTITLPERVEITALIELVGKQLGLNYIYDEGQVRGQVMLKVHDGKIKVKDMYALLESVLKFRGFVMSRRGNLVTIVPSANSLDVDPEIREKGEAVRPGDVVVTSIFNLENIDTMNAVTLLNNMKLGIQVTPIVETNTLIVTEYAYRIERIEKLLSLVDVPGEQKVFRHRQLKYTIASQLAPKIQKLAEQLEGVSVTVEQTTAQPTPSRTTTSRTPVRRPTTPTPTAQQAQPPQEIVYLDTDDRTNRVFMIGRESQVEVVNELIDALDVEKQDLRSIQQYEIQFVGAEEVRNKLIDLGIISGARASTGTSSSRQTTTRTTARPGPQPQTPTMTTVTEQTPEEILEGEAVVVVLESTNSLLVNATPEQHTQITMVISYVDSQLEEAANPYVVYSLENQDPEDLADVLQKVVEAQLEQQKDQEGKVQSVARNVAEEDRITIVPDKNTFSIIVYASKKYQEQIGKLIQVLDKRRPQVLIDVALVEITRNDQFQYDLNIVTNAGEDVIDNIAIKSDGGLPITTANPQIKYLEGGWNIAGDGAFTGFYGIQQIQTLLELIDSKDYGRILAQPKLLANDNETGTIKTVTSTYIAEETTTIPTDGIAQTSTEFKQYDATIQLEITPTISEGDLLRLEITLTREDFLNEPTDRPPDKAATDVTTIVTVPDGKTIILGGLTKLNQNKTGSKIPLLGDIPLVGTLFRGVNNTDRANHLYIFVKSHIVRPDDVTFGMKRLQEISDEYRKQFEEEEKKFQYYEQFPGVKPTPQEPVRVLEDINE